MDYKYIKCSIAAAASEVGELVKYTTSRRRKNYAHQWVLRRSHRRCSLISKAAGGGGARQNMKVDQVSALVTWRQQTVRQSIRLPPDRATTTSTGVSHTKLAGWLLKLDTLFIAYIITAATNRFLCPLQISIYNFELARSMIFYFAIIAAGLAIRASHQTKSHWQ